MGKPADFPFKKRLQMFGFCSLEHGNKLFQRRIWVCHQKNTDGFHASLTERPECRCGIGKETTGKQCVFTQHFSDQVFPSRSWHLHNRSEMHKILLTVFVSGQHMLHLRIYPEIMTNFLKMIIMAASWSNDSYARYVFSYLTSNFLNRLNQEWTSSTIQRCALNPFRIAIFSSTRGRMCGSSGILA